MNNSVQPCILIVDDEPATIRVLAQIVEDLGRVIFAISGEEAVRISREQRPDLILLDIQMPGMDGYETCRQIKGNPNLLDIPILFVTSHAELQDEVDALEAGAVDFIIKPLSPPLIRARVKTHLALKQRTDELFRMATSDSLTRIANRRAFDSVLEQEWARAWRTRTNLTVAIMDIDQFKQYNDTLGHPAGDDALQDVAAALSAALLRAGDLVARFGGEEFAAILPTCDERKGLVIGEKLREAVVALSLPHPASQVTSVVTISVGMASLVFNAGDTGNAPSGYAPCGTSADLVSMADRALYTAKSEGRNQVISLKLLV